MKRDNLEDFIKQNRDAFYDDAPPPELWNDIEKSMPAGRRFPIIRQTLRYAAAALVLIAVSVAATRYFVLSDIRQKGISATAHTRNHVPKIIFIHTVSPAPVLHKDKSPIADTLSKPAAVKNQSQKTPGIYNDLEEINVFYKSQIYERKNQIIRLASVSGEISQQVDAEIKQMDSLYRAVIRDLKDNINNKEVVEALILQYRLKLDFLDNILLHIKESENPSPENSDMYEK